MLEISWNNQLSCKDSDEVLSGQEALAGMKTGKLNASLEVPIGAIWYFGFGILWDRFDVNNTDIPFWVWKVVIEYIKEHISDQLLEINRNINLEHEYMIRCGIQQRSLPGSQHEGKFH